MVIRLVCFLLVYLSLILFLLFLGGVCLANLLKFYGLGSFYLEYQSIKIDGSNWVSKRALELLMYLSFKLGRRTDAEEIIDLFWPDSDLETGKNKLYNTIYLLRKSLQRAGLEKELIKSLQGGYLINNNYLLWTDWGYFIEKGHLYLQQKNVSTAELTELLKIYRGDFFALLRYESWPKNQRDILSGLHLALLEKLIIKLYENDDYQLLFNYLNQGLNLDPYAEIFYLIYFKVFVKLGKTKEAINIYQKCKDILAAELDLEPGPELQQEYLNLKAKQDIIIKNKLDFKQTEIGTGAMICDQESFKKIYELELRSAKRKNIKFILLTIDLSNSQINSDFKNVIKQTGAVLRTGDVICSCNKKIYIILREIGFKDTGIILTRFDQVFKRFNLASQASIDLKEVN